DPDVMPSGTEVLLHLCQATSADLSLWWLTSSRLLERARHGIDLGDGGCGPPTERQREVRLLPARLLNYRDQLAATAAVLDDVERSGATASSVALRAAVTRQRAAQVEDTSAGEALATSDLDDAASLLGQAQRSDPTALAVAFECAAQLG